MFVIYVIMMAIPVALAMIIYLVLRRWTRLRPTTRSAVATLSAPGLLLLLYSQSTSTVDADERAAVALALAFYLVAAGFTVGLLEWRYLSRK